MQASSKVNHLSDFAVGNLCLIHPYSACQWLGSPRSCILSHKRLLSTLHSDNYSVFRECQLHKSHFQNILLSCCDDAIA